MGMDTVLLIIGNLDVHIQELDDIFWSIILYDFPHLYMNLKFMNYLLYCTSTNLMSRIS